MKKTLLLVALGAASLTLSGCKKAEEAPTADTAAAEAPAADASAAPAADPSAAPAADASAAPGDNGNDVNRKP